MSKDNDYSVQPNPKADDEYVVKIDIVDTGGAPEYASLREEALKNSSGFLCVYDMSKKETLEELAADIKTAQEIKNKEQKPVTFVFVRFIGIVTCGAGWCQE